MRKKIEVKEDEFKNQVLSQSWRYGISKIDRIGLRQEIQSHHTTKKKNPQIFVASGNTTCHILNQVGPNHLTPRHHHQKPTSKIYHHRHLHSTHRSIWELDVVNLSLSLVGGSLSLSCKGVVVSLKQECFLPQFCAIVGFLSFRSVHLFCQCMFKV